MKKIDSKAQVKLIEDIEKLAADCGYTWYKGMHPDEHLSVLLTMFTELRLLKRAQTAMVAIPAPVVREL